MRRRPRLLGLHVAGSSFKFQVSGFQQAGTPAHPDILLSHQSKTNLVFGNELMNNYMKIIC